MRVRPFPPTEKGAIQRSSIFKSGATYGLYGQHLANACHLAGEDADWLTASVRSAARGLRKDRDTSLRIRNFASVRMLSDILVIDGRGSQLVQAAYLSLLFSIRVPSETLFIQRDFGALGN